MGRLLIVLGVVVLVIGVLMLVAEKAGFRGLPGDIRYESSRVRVYFPIVTCLVLSILLTLGMWLWNWLRR
jgi:hypothetical protein